MRSHRTAIRSAEDVLGSWRDGRAREAILDFIAGVIEPASAGFVPPPERLAVFDGDGTLWPERPAIEAHFALTRINAAAAADPDLRLRQPFKAALEADLEALTALTSGELLELVSTSHGWITAEQFEEEVVAFFRSAVHPTLRIPYAEARYLPMCELVELLVSNDFTVWVCASGTAEFARLRAERFTGVPRSLIIASRLNESLYDLRDQLVIWRAPGVVFVNEGAARALAVASLLGCRPLLVAGNAGDSADLELMRYAQGRAGRSCQLLVYHDDPARDVDYGASARETLVAAARFGFNVVSVKRDWRLVLPVEPAGAGHGSPPDAATASSNL